MAEFVTDSIRESYFTEYPPQPTVILSDPEQSQGESKELP